MQDRDLEALLAQYRPAGPPEALDSRLRQGALSTVSRSPTRRTWPWAVAAAALLTVTIGLHAFTITGGAAPVAVDPGPLAQQLGGDALAYNLARITLSSPPPVAADDMPSSVPWIP